MKAWRVHEHGDFREVLRLDEVDDPRPQPGGAVVRVRAAGLNFPDILAIAGRYQVKLPTPFVPGIELCGVVEAIGDGSRLAVGDRVLVGCTSGALAEKIGVLDGQCLPAPESLSDAEVSGFLCTYQTAWFALIHRAHLRSGETVLVHGGAGGVGSACIQVAKAHGARVIATAGGAAKVEICRELGADDVIDYRSEDFVEAVKALTEGRGADVICDPVGGDVFDGSTRCIAWEGRLLPLGFTSGRIASVATNRILLKNISVVGLFWGRYLEKDPALVVRCHAALTALADAGSVRPRVGMEVPLEEAVSALEAIADRRITGKAVVVPAG